MDFELLEELAKAKKVTGAKQTARALEKGIAVRLYVAADADKRVIMPLLDLAKTKEIEVNSDYKISELGKACGIAVGAAAAAIVR
ncbi:MAG: ribosomal L7Ae/L30e/S12e/Gadd45 family protein [Sporomusaceae bacterium]|nr:ribosomal L7Ae/L30e/S12e/Gadd45 family protein [Sporomusaceae bacterium]